MNHPIDLTANQETSGREKAIDLDDQMSWDGQENAPPPTRESAFDRGKQPDKQPGLQRKGGFINRLADKLKRAEPLRPNPPANPRFAETQLGNEQSPAMNFHYTPGSQPLPRYTIRRGIGVGGFGEVYFAVTDAGKEVAMKRIQRNLEIELRGASQCLNLKHPNLVALYDICRDDEDQSWVVMEYVAGKNLRQVLDQSPHGLPLDQVNRWFTAIAAGISHLHSAGLVHRDIKPGNVFDDLGTVKVGDYGLSKYISASHRGGHTESVGTFHYMAPEIGRGQYGREIDIYALGILLYELLTGRVPFDGESSHEIIVKHLTAMPDLSGIAEPYRSVIARSLEKDPGKRFATVDQMLAALANDQPVAAGPAAGVVAAHRAAQHKAAQHRAAQQHGANQPGAAPPGDRRGSEQPIAAKLVSHSPGGGPAPAAASSPHGPRALAQEPLARALESSFSDLNNWWKSLDRSPGLKVALALAAGFFLLLNSHWLILVLTLTGIFYVPYYIMRQMVLHVRQQPSYAEAQRIAGSVAVARPPRPVSRRQWCQQMRADLRAKRSLSRAAELHTSWMATTMTVAGMALGAGALGLRDEPIDALGMAPYSWMAAVIWMSSFAILGLGKLWEREDGEGLPRRFVLAGLGAGIGAGAFAIHQYLMLPVGPTIRDIDATELPPALYADGMPLAGAMMAHFALLFSLLRWWKPVDPLRRRRLSVWSVAVAVVAEWAVHQVLPIPQPAGMMIAGGTAIAIQLGAPWINRRAQTEAAAIATATPPRRPHCKRSLA